MIAKIPFGNTGHMSTRTLFGAAALGGMRQEKADQILEILLEYGVNHIDVAASYGDAELRIGPWMAAHRDKFTVSQVIEFASLNLYAPLLYRAQSPNQRQERGFPGAGGTGHDDDTARHDV